MIELPDIAGFAIASHRGDETQVSVGPEVGEAAFLRLLLWLPPAHELSFYDQYFPGTRNDPGAYVDIQRKDDLFQYHLANHGWFQDWSYQSGELLAALMALNLRAKPDNPVPMRKLRITEGARLPRAFTRG